MSASWDWPIGRGLNLHNKLSLEGVLCTSNFVNSDNLLTFHVSSSRLQAITEHIFALPLLRSWPGPGRRPRLPLQKALPVCPSCDPARQQSPSSAAVPVLTLPSLSCSAALWLAADDSVSRSAGRVRTAQPAPGHRCPPSASSSASAADCLPILPPPLHVYISIFSHLGRHLLASFILVPIWITDDPGRPKRRAAEFSISRPLHTSKCWYCGPLCLLINERIIPGRRGFNLKAMTKT